MANRPPYPGTPRWVKVFGIIILVVVLLVVATVFISGGEHGPARHTPSGDAGGQVSPSNVTVSSITEDYTPPEGGH